MEAPQLENVKQQFIDEEVVIITAGKDWGQPYSCEQWATNFGLSIPILDDEIDSLSNLFGYPPHNIVIDGYGQVIYSAPGHNLQTIINVVENSLSTIIQDSDSDTILDDIDNCINVYNPDQSDYDFDNIGDECDICDNLNIFTSYVHANFVSMNKNEDIARPAKSDCYSSRPCCSKQHRKG